MRISTTHKNRLEYKIHIISSKHVCFIIDDKDYNLTPKSQQTNDTLRFGALSQIAKPSMAKNEKYYKIWKAYETGEYVSVYCQCSIAKNESDMVGHAKRQCENERNICKL